MAWLALNSAQETTPLAQAQALVGSLVAAGCDATLLVRAGSAHGFGYWHSEWPTIEAFIREGATDPLYRQVLTGSQILRGGVVEVPSPTRT